MRIAIGLDVAKEKSDVVAISEFGEIIFGPISVLHDINGLSRLYEMLCRIEGDKVVVMENTSHYWKQPAMTFLNYGINVCVLNPILIHGFGTNTIRQVKTDKADAKRIAQYAIAYWNELRLFMPEDEIREMLKIQARLYVRICNICASMKNNLIALCDQVNPGINKFYGQTELNEKGHFKWIDLLQNYWHRECITSLSIEQFDESYRTWCRKLKYAYRRSMAEKIYLHANNTIATYKYNEETRKIVQQTANTLSLLYENLYTVRKEINRLASLLPEYDVVMQMDGCGPVIGPLIIAEIGDVLRFKNKKSLIAYAGLDSKPYQSGQYEAKSRKITKKGSSILRRNIFTAVKMIYMNKSEGNVVYDFMVKKKNEGKHYYVVMVAGCSKFLKVYYGTVKKELLENRKIKEIESL